MQSNIFRIEDPKNFIKKFMKEEKKIEKMLQAPEYIKERKEIISSPNLMLIQKKRPIKKMLFKSHSIEVASGKLMDSNSCPPKNSNYNQFKFVAIVEEKNGTKTEKSLDSMTNGLMKPHIDTSQVLSKFTSYKSQIKIKRNLKEVK